MFIDAMGLILADNKKITLGELSKPRALAAVPFGGRYRIIDFMLSNMVNSGIKSVGILTLNKYQSLMDHLGTGSSWDLDRKNNGLNLLPPYISSEALNIEDANEMDGLLNYLHSNKATYVVISASNMILNVTFNSFIEEHEASKADMSVLYNRDGIKYGHPNYIFDLDRKGYIKDMLHNPEKTRSNRCSLGIVIIKRDFLIDLIAEMIAHGEKSFSMQTIVKKYDQYKVRAHEYHGLVLRINNIQTYFNSSISLLEEKVRKNLFWHGKPIYTKVKDEAPTIYLDQVNASNSIVSDGCTISGKIKDSVLFRGITVSKGTTIVNSIIMQDVHISEGCHLENVIIDKNAVIRPYIKLIGHQAYPVVIGKGSIV